IAVFDRHEVDVDLELAAVFAPRGRFAVERLPGEDVVEKRAEDRLVLVDDAEDDRRLPDDVGAIRAVERQESVADERDPRPDRLDRGSENGDAKARDMNRAA